MGLEWRSIPGASMYEVSSRGEVRSWRYGRSFQRRAEPRLLKSTLDKAGYLQVALIGDDGTRLYRRVHQWVLLAFRGPRPFRLEARHVNGIKTDNRLSNLIYATHSRNIRDQVRHGTHNNSAKARCPRGHIYDRTGKKVNGGSQRICSVCANELRRRQSAEARAMRTVAALIANESRAMIEVERIRGLIPPATMEVATRASGYAAARAASA